MTKSEMTDQSIALQNRQNDMPLVERCEIPAEQDTLNRERDDLLGEIFAGLSSLA